MKRTAVLWILASVITLASALYQRWTGPSYPIRPTIALGGQTYKLKLERTHGGEGDQPVLIRIPDAEVHGRILWRFYPSTDEWQTLDLQRKGDLLEGFLPHQPPAGKLEYQLQLKRGSEQRLVPEKPAITRFKGDVAPELLYPHIAAMFFGMLLSTRTGVEAAFKGPRVRAQTHCTLALLFIGGLILGPLVQKAAFGELWTGVPFGWDLTDNKTLIAVLAWMWAIIRQRGQSMARWSVVAAAVVTLIVFAIPHSIWGSQLSR